MHSEDNLTKLVKRIHSHRGLQERIEAILDIAENKSGDLITADQAEGKAIEEIGKLGKELLREWAVHQHDEAVKTAGRTHPNAKRHEKKSSTGKRHSDK